MEDYEKKYKDVLAKAREIHRNEAEKRFDMEWLFPEIKESEDERIRKALIKGVESCKASGWTNFGNNVDIDVVLAWLEKQGDTNETINRDEFAQGILRGAAINLITWIDYNVAEGNMCLSNMECEDIEGALVSGDWDKIYTYIKKKLEKQGEQKPFDYEHVTITQKGFACDVEEASYTAEVATGDGSIKTVVSKKVSLPNPQSKE